MNRSTLIGVIAVIIAIAAGAFALTIKSNNSSQPTNTQSSSNTSSTNSSQATGSIDIKGMQFKPSQISVQKGGTVTWTNNDSTTHTVTDDLSNVGGPDSGDIKPGSTYSFTFNKAGSYQYHCTIHPSMRGTIVVK